MPRRCAGGDADRAARRAFWIGFGLLSRGEPVRGGGWLARAARHAEEVGPDSLVHGYLLVPPALGEHEAGNFEAAAAAFGKPRRSPTCTRTQTSRRSPDWGSGTR